MKPRESEALYVRRGFLREVAKYLPSQKVFVLSEKQVASFYLGALEKGLAAEGKCVSSLVLEGGEACKALSELSVIYQALQDFGADRSTCFLTLGGGVVSDLGGFVASTYQRGMRLYHVPTSLMGQVDAAIGGKTGLNLPSGKNQVGTFYQADGIFVDPDCLMTLPEREWRNGLAEVVKYALLFDADLWSFLLGEEGEWQTWTADQWDWIVERCAQQKARVVGRDFLDTGERRLLNLGHSFGHAIEQVGGYGVYAHGEAVGLGLLLALQVGLTLGVGRRDLLEQLQALLEHLGLPTTLPRTYTAERLMKAIGHDKKKSEGQLALVLLEGAQRPKIQVLEIAQVRDLLEEALQSVWATS